MGDMTKSQSQVSYRAQTCVRHAFWSRLSPTFHCSSSHTMVLTSTDDSVSILKDGKLKPGVYKIQNIVGQTYVDIREHSRELCGRPATVLEGKGLVGSCPYLALTILSLPSVGNPAFGSRVYHTQSSVELRSSFLCTERGNIARTRHA